MTTMSNGPTAKKRTRFIRRPRHRHIAISLATALLAMVPVLVLLTSSVTAQATATAPDCTTATNFACLHEDHENVTATSFGSTCDFEVQGTTTDGFHFILPESEGVSFTSLTVYFSDLNGATQTVTTTTFVGPHNKGAIINVPNGWTLLEGNATITTDDKSATSTGTDGGNPFFNLSSTCAGTGTVTPSPSPSGSIAPSASPSASVSPTPTGGVSPEATTSPSPSGGTLGEQSPSPTSGVQAAATNPALPKSGTRGSAPNIVAIIVLALTLFVLVFAGTLVALERRFRASRER